jgi:spermidine synthase
MLWRTHNDAVIVGSNTPFLIDEAELERRIAEPVIAADLQAVTMGSATDFLSYCVMGTEGMKRFGQSGTLNTDDHLYLEFSAPFSIASPEVMAAGVAAISANRESILPYLKPAQDPDARADQQKRWGVQLAAGRLSDRALALFLGRGPGDREVDQALGRLALEHPGYAPGRALTIEYRAALALEPRLIDQTSFNLMGEDGKATVLQIAAVLVPVSEGRASIMLVDNRARVVYGQIYIDDYLREGRANRLAWDVMVAMQAAYDQHAIAARDQKKSLPPAAETLRSIKAAIESKVQGAQPKS